MNNKIHKSAPYFLATIATLAIGTPVAFAQELVNYAPLTTIPGIFEAGVKTNPVSVIKGLYGLAIGAGSVIAVVMIILAGFKYMYEESISGKSGAKDQIQNAFLGLLVILGSYILLRTINADLVNFNPQLPGGTGSVSGLVASDELFEKAQAEIRAAQANVTKLNNEAADIDAQIAIMQTDLDNADDVDAADPRWEAIERLTAERDAKKSQAAYETAIALTDHGVAVVEAYLSSPDTGTRINTDNYFNSGRESLDEARAKLDALYTQTRNPEVAKQIEDIDAKKFILQSDQTQLDTVKNYQNADGITGSLFNSKNKAVEAIKKSGDTTIYNLQQLGGYEAEIAEIREATARRVKIICPTCN